MVGPSLPGYRSVVHLQTIMKKMWILFQTIDGGVDLVLFNTIHPLLVKFEGPELVGGFNPSEKY